MGEKKETDERYFFETPGLGIKLYQYTSVKNNRKIKPFHPRDLDWLFPDKWYQSIGFTIHGFLFKFKNAPKHKKHTKSAR